MFIWQPVCNTTRSLHALCSDQFFTTFTIVSNSINLFLHTLTQVLTCIVRHLCSYMYAEQSPGGGNFWHIVDGGHTHTEVWTGMFENWSTPYGLVISNIAKLKGEHKNTWQISYINMSKTELKIVAHANGRPCSHVCAYKNPKSPLPPPSPLLNEYMQNFKDSS
jgi:hypothetical protein